MPSVPSAEVSFSKAGLCHSCTLNAVPRGTEMDMVGGRNEIQVPEGAVGRQRGVRIPDGQVAFQAGRLRERLLNPTGFPGFAAR